jgi:elongation factor G
MMRERLGAVPLVLQLPWFVDDTFQGILDLLTMKAILWEEETLGAEFTEMPIPQELQTEASRYREALLETLADTNDRIMEKYLGEEDIPLKELLSAVRSATVNLQLVPILCGSALKNKGIQPLLDAIVQYLPSPLEVPPIVGHVPSTGEEESRKADPHGPFSALAFKVRMDQGRKMTYMRVYSGTVKTGQAVHNPDQGITEKLARILKMHADKRERVDRASAGDIIAAMGLKLTTTGDTLCSADRPILLEPIQFNEPVITMAVEPKRVQDHDKLLDVLGKLSDEDPTLRYKVDEETGQVVVSGMGELHLDIIMGRVMREYSVDTNRGRPQVVYRETIEATAKHEEVFHRDLAGQQHFAGVTVEVSPLPRGTGCRFLDRCAHPDMNEEFLYAVREGVSEAEMSGVLMGYPVIDVQTVLLDAQIKEDSDVLAFKVVSAMAFRNACQKASPVLLEPVMAAEVLVPEEFTGEVISDLNTRQGKIENIIKKGPVQVIKASVALSNMFGYSTALRSLTQGRGTFTMQFSHYDKP